MALTEAEIAKLLALPDKQSRKRKSSIDYSDPDSRTYENWFKFAAKLYDEETGDSPRCLNPDCIDTRTRSQLVVRLDIGETTYQMCRICFIDGWGCKTDG